MDSYNEAIEEYVETIRLEGQKALSLATNRINSDMKLRFNQEADHLRACLAERERAIVDLEAELVTRKESCNRVGKQLRLFATLVSKRGEQSRLLQLDTGARGLLEIWLSKAKKVKREREGDRLATILHQCKFGLRVYHAWHLLAVTGQMGRANSEQLHAKQESLDRMTVERDRGRQEIRRLNSEIEMERSKRANLIGKIKSTFNSKLDTLLTEN